MAKILGRESAETWLLNRGPDYCSAQIKIMFSQTKTVKNQRQWLLRALEENWTRWQPQYSTHSDPAPAKPPEQEPRNPMTLVQQLAERLAAKSEGADKPTISRGGG